MNRLTLFALLVCALFARDVHARPRVCLANAVPAPTISSVSPEEGPSAGGQTLTITGTGFGGGNLTSIKIGSVTCGSLSVATGTSATCVTPSLATIASSNSDVTVTGPAGSNKISSGFWVHPAGDLIFLRGDLGITLDGSNNVQTWADQSGNANGMSQATSGVRPAWESTGLVNSKASVRMTSAPKWMQGSLGSTYTGTTLTVILVVNTAAVSAARFYAGYQNGDTGDTTQTHGSLIYTPAATLINNYRTGAHASITVSSFASAKSMVISSRWDATNNYVRQNGVDSAANAFATAFALNRYLLGSGLTGGVPGSNAFASIDITEFIVSSSVWGSSDYTACSVYTTARYGLSC